MEKEEEKQEVQGLLHFSSSVMDQIKVKANILVSDSHLCLYYFPANAAPPLLLPPPLPPSRQFVDNNTEETMV